MISERLANLPIHLNELVARALDAVVGMDDDGRIIAWNPSAEDIFGWTADQAIGARMSRMIVPPQHRAAHEAGLENFKRSGKGPVLNSRIRITALNAAGEEFPVELSILPIHSEPPVFYAFIRSLVEEERVNREREIRAKEAEIISAISAAQLEDISTDEFVRRCLMEICEVAGWKAGHFYKFDVPDRPTVLRPSGVWHISAPEFEFAAEVTSEYTFRYGEGLPGTVWKSGGAVLIDDIAKDHGFSRREPFLKIGLTTAMAFPLRSSTGLSGVMEFFGTAASRRDMHLFSFAETIGNHVELAFQRRIDAEQREILRRELSHRLGNSLAVLQSLFRRCAREAGDVADLCDRFEPRLHAVGIAHRMVAMEDQSSRNLLALVKGVVDLLPEADRIRIDGAPLDLSRGAVLPLTLTLHELVTNSLKYGRWHEAGSLEISWQLTPGRDVELTWTEAPAEPPEDPDRQGYGSLLIRTMVETSLNGRMERSFEGGAFTLRIVFPLGG